MIKGRMKGKGGFSLVEVCLAVLVVGLGILSIFSLFPTGLAASESASADTETGLFAEEVLFGLQASASEVSWEEWKGNRFVVPDIQFGTAAMNANNTIAYYLQIMDNTTRVERVKEVILYAMPWRAATPATSAAIHAKGNKFYTELFYMELPW
jgi:Tfp pilus assembly protein PilV